MTYGVIGGLTYGVVPSLFFVYCGKFKDLIEYFFLNFGCFYSANGPDIIFASFCLGLFAVVVVVSDNVFVCFIFFGSQVSLMKQENNNNKKIYIYIFLTMFTVFTSESRGTQAAISFTCKSRLTYGVVLARRLATSILKNKKTVIVLQEQTLLLFRLYGYI